MNNVCGDGYIRNIKKVIAKRKKIFLEEIKKHPQCPWCHEPMIKTCLTCGERYLCNRCGHIVLCGCPDYPIQEEFIK